MTYQAEDFKCPITHDWLSPDPKVYPIYMAADGHVYSYAIKHWLTRSRKSPITNEPMDKHLIKNPMPFTVHYMEYIKSNNIEINPDDYKKDVSSKQPLPFIPLVPNILMIQRWRDNVKRAVDVNIRVIQSSPSTIHTIPLFIDFVQKLNRQLSYCFDQNILLTVVQKLDQIHFNKLYIDRDFEYGVYIHNNIDIPFESVLLMGAPNEQSIPIVEEINDIIQSWKPLIPKKCFHTMISIHLIDGNDSFWSALKKSWKIARADDDKLKRWADDYGIQLYMPMFEESRRKLNRILMNYDLS